MARAGDEILVVFLDGQPEGLEFERRRERWPLHVTLVSWFGPGDEARLESALDRTAQETETFRLVLGAQALFGHEHDIPVNIIADQERVAVLHRRLSECVAASAMSLPANPWAGDAYRAHVTLHGDADDRRAGDEFVVDSFYRVRLLPDNVCRVVKRYMYGDVR